MLRMDHHVFDLDGAKWKGKKLDKLVLFICTVIFCLFLILVLTYLKQGKQALGKLGGLAHMFFPFIGMSYPSHCLPLSMRNK